MRALPERLESTWRSAKCDPDGVVEYLLEPLSNRLTLDIGMRANKPDGIDAAGSIFDSVSYGLKGLRYLMYETECHPDTLLPFELEFEDTRVGRETIKRVTDASLARLPNSLVIEISNALAEISGITDKEADDLKNTSGSPEPDSNAETALGTRTNVDTTAETEESCSEPETFPSTTP